MITVREDNRRLIRAALAKGPDDDEVTLHCHSTDKEVKERGIIIDKTLLLTARSIGGLFSRVKRYYSSKIRCGDTVGRGMRIGGSPF